MKETIIRMNREKNNKEYIKKVYQLVRFGIYPVSPNSWYLIIKVLKRQSKSYKET